jgi:hypothetical protein
MTATAITTITATATPTANTTATANHCDHDHDRHQYRHRHRHHHLPLLLPLTTAAVVTVTTAATMTATATNTHQSCCHSYRRYCRHHRFTLPRQTAQLITPAPPPSPAVSIPAHYTASIAIKFLIKEGCNWPRWQRELGESTQQTISLASGEFRVRPMEEALRKMKILRVGINKSIWFKFLSRKRFLSKKSFLVQSTERETQNGGTKQDKKMAIGRKMGGDGQECLGKYYRPIIICCLKNLTHS